jgi:hypothetical protein
MATINYWDAATQSWKPLSVAVSTGGSGGVQGPPGPKGDKGDKGDPGESVTVSVQPSQPALARAGDVWISQ